jgi:hypothetical protein
MNEVDRRLAVIAAQQRQVFTRCQARDAGLSFNAIHRRIDSGALVVVGPHTLTFAGVILDWRGQLKAGLLDLGAEALVTAESGAALLGFDGYEQGPLVYLVPRSLRNRKTNGIVIATPTIEPLDRTEIDGLAVTSGTRTVVELIGRVSPTGLGNALDSACRKRLTAPSVVDRRLAKLGGKGRAGVADYDLVRTIAGVESWLERAFIRLVRRSGLPEPAVQLTYRRDGAHIARVDFDFAPLPVIVEVGGQRGYLSLAERQRQERRRNEVQLLGKMIYFFCTDDVRSDPGYVVKTLRTALGLEAS